MRLPVARILQLLTAITIVLLAMHTFILWYRPFIPAGLRDSVVQKFHLNSEANIPTWYSAVLLFSVAVAAYILYRIERRSPRGSAFAAKFWLGFAGAYVFFSLDETAQIHELIQKAADVKWYLVYGPIVGLFFLGCIYYFFVIPGRKTSVRNWVVGGLSLFAAGGLGFEWLYYTFSPRHIWRMITIAAEEGFELIGTILVLTGLLYELNEHIESRAHDSTLSTAAAQNVDVDEHQIGASTK